MSTVSSAPSPLVILGCGFVGAEVARLARSAHPSAQPVVAVTRSPQRAAALAALGVDARATGPLTPELAAALVPVGARILVAYPPTGTDVALAPALRRARSIVYISSTGVYGDASGRIDEDTPVDPSTPRAAARLEAEAAYRAEGAVILRSAAIYGPARGLHLRLQRGEHRLIGDGHQIISRIHVEDLARLALAAFDRAAPRAVFNVGDDAPVPQLEVVTWLCARLGLPVPEGVAPGDAPETLRHDRSIDNARLKRALGLSLLHPTYREGLTACLEANDAAAEKRA